MFWRRGLDQRRSLSTIVRETHKVFNQARPFVGVDLYESDKSLQSCLQGLSVSQLDRVREYGKKCGTAEMMALADEAEANPPTLRQFDNYGNRVDVLDYVSAYHRLKQHTIEGGCTVLGHNDAQNPSTHVTRAALLLMSNQLEPGHCCPVTMTSAAVPVLQTKDAHPVVKDYLSMVLKGRYDPSDRAIADKAGVTIGMSMTEGQGGSDVRSNTTIATAVNGDGNEGRFTLRGHKWFTSAAMSDGFLTLAKVGSSDDALPSCFLVPRWLPNGIRNSGFHIMRMKNKMGDRANASSEIEYHDCAAFRVGEVGKGIKTILQMVQLTRLDCCIGATGGMRRALQVALNHTATRSAFGATLSQQPLMELLLAELCCEAEAHTLSTMRMAQAYGNSLANGSGDTGSESDLFRVGVAIMKFYSTKAVPHFTYECLESLGGNGFTEDFPMARLFRHSPLNSIWEGSGNVMALDVLRAAKGLPAFLAEVSRAKGQDAAFDRFVVDLVKAVKGVPALSPADQQRAARNLCDRLAIALQGSLMLRLGQPDAAELFLRCRVRGGDGARNYGAAAHSIAPSVLKAVVENHMPVFQ